MTFTVSAWVSVKYDIQPTFSFVGSGMIGNDFRTDIYQKPWFRIGPYIIGVMMAFLYREENTKIFYSNQITRLLIYVFAFSGTFILSYVPYTYWIGSGWSMSGVAFYNACSRTLFCVALCTFMMATFYGHGGLLKYFLELPVWKPISKLTYATYLVHPMVIYIRVLSATVLFHYSWTEFAYTFIGNLIILFRG
eukprot:gene4322-5409_t